jgi:formylmethanofuran dehydrogenase subunit C
MAGAEIRTGAWMNRGTIISLKPLPLMPTFVFTCCQIPVFVNVYARHLQQFGIRLPFAEKEGTYHHYRGDAAVSHKGEILIWQPAQC